MTLMNSGISVYLSYLGRDFYNALSEKRVEEFWDILAKYLGVLLGAVPITVFYKFQRERLSVSWREWMTERVLQVSLVVNLLY